MIPSEPRLPDDSLPKLTRQLTTLWRSLSITLQDAVSFLSAGAGAITRPLRDKIQEIEVSVFDFMTAQQVIDVQDRALMLDVTASIQAAIDYIASKGGGRVRMPPGAYRIESGITNTGNNVSLVGDGPRHSHALALTNPDYATEIVAYGTAGYTMLTWAPVAGAGNQRISGGGVEDISLNGNATAAIGLLVASVWDADFRIYTKGQTAYGTKTSVVSALGESADTQDCRFWLRFDHRNSSCTALLCTGDSGGNTSMNRFNILGFFQNGTCIVLNGSDSNYFEYIRLFQQFGGTGLFVDVLGDNGGGLHSGAERFGFYAGAGPIYFRGSTSGYSVYSMGNCIEYLDWANGAPAPIIEAGASCEYADAKGRHVITDVGWKRINPNQLSFINYAENEQARITAITTAPTGIPDLRGGTGKATYAVEGSATNVDLELLPKGTGKVLVPNGNLDSGTYTPTAVLVANLASATPTLCQYMRVGNVVTVSGSSAADPTLAANTQTTMRLSLPIASNLGAASDGNGTCSFIETPPNFASGPIFANAANDQITLTWLSPTANAGTVYFHFTYRII